MEFYVKSINDPNFQIDKLQQDDEISMLLTQLQVILGTRKGDVLGNPDFGANLEDYVYEFRYNDYMLKNIVEQQISAYVPHAAKYNVEVDIQFLNEVYRHTVYLDIIVDSRFNLGVYV